jgi:hypothetical protein
LAAGILATCGADFGDVCGATPYNQRGQFENPRVRRALIKAPLVEEGYDPLGVDSLPPRGEELRREDLEWGQCPPAFKDPKLLLVWPDWRRAFPGARWVVTLRDLDDVADSMRRTPWFCGVDPRALAEEYQARAMDLSRSSDRVMYIRPGSIVRGNRRHAETLVRWCGLSWQPERVAEWIDASLWHEGGIR